MSPRPAPLWRDPAFVQGARDMSGPAVGIAAWGLVTGVAMIKSGLSLPVALAMSLLVFAGSAQLAVIPLLAAGAPMGLVWATAACVNLRFLIVSTQWRPYFAHLPFGERLRISYFAADFNYALFMRRHREPAPQPGQVAYFWGGVAVNWPSWQVMSIVGILLGDRIPGHWGLGFAGILALIGLIGSMLTDRATWITAGVAAVTSVLAYGLPHKLNIVAAIVAALVVGVLVDRAWPRAATGKGAST